MPADHAPTLTVADVSATWGHVYNASDIIHASDVDNDALTYTIYDYSGDPSSGHFVVNGAVQSAFTPIILNATQFAQTTFVAGASTGDQIYVQVSDGLLSSSQLSFNVTLPANHAPTITGAVAGQALTDKQTDSPFSGVTIGDTDTPAQTETLTITLDSAAKGALSNLGSGSYNAGTGVYTVSGTAAAVTSAVDGLVFTPTANHVAPGTTETTTFTIGVNDGIAATVTDNTTTVVTTSVNDAPTITGTVANQAITDKQTDSPFSGVAIGDVDSAQTETLTITLDNASKGALSNLGSGSYNVVTGVYTVNGTAAAVTSAVDGLVFTPTANHVAPGTTETTTFTIGVNDGIAATVTDNTATVVATSVNDAPTITGTVANQAITDQQTDRPFSGVTIGDVDSPAQTEALTITLDDHSKGALSNLGSGSYNAATGVYTISGTAAAVTTAVDGLVFTPTADHVARGLTETTTFTIGVNDGVAATVTDNATTVVTTSVNHAPTLTVADVSATRGQVYNASDIIHASDVDSDALTYTIYDYSGDPSSGHFAVNGAVQSPFTPIVLNASQFAQTTFVAGTTASDQIYVQVSDGQLSSSQLSFNVNVPANHAPTLTVADVSATRGQVYNASDIIHASDVDNDALTYTIYDYSDDPSSGHFVVNGAVQLAFTPITLNATQFAQTTFVAGASASDHIYAQVSDGLLSSAQLLFNVNVPAEQAPILTAQNVSPTPGQVLQASDLFTATIDAAGDQIQSYLIYDYNDAANSGHFEVNGVVQSAYQPISLTPTDFSHTTFVAGAAGIVDPIYVTASDGIQSSVQLHFDLLAH